MRLLLITPCSAIIGPLTYVAVSWATSNHRLAILASGSFFVVGLAILLGVDVRRGREAALQPAGES